MSFPPNFPIFTVSKAILLKIEDFQKENGVKVTYTHFIMKAVVDTLKEYPKFNSWMNVEELIQKKDINLGFAAALPDGNLIVPNIKKVNDMSLKEMRDLVARGRATLGVG